MSNLARGRGGQGRPAASLLQAFRDGCEGIVLKRETTRWPDPKWQSDPVGFARTILGVDLWSFQVEFLEAIRDNRHVSVAGGRKIGKDYAVAIASLWWYSSFKDARVILLAPTSKQLDGISYLEIRKLKIGSGRCFECKQIDPEGPRPCDHSAIVTGTMGTLARTGIHADDFRETIGLTAISEGGLRGLSGARILAIEDEASDIKDEFDTALVGNLAGADCHRAMISNPTHVSGFFYRSHHEERDLFAKLQVSSLDNPNVKQGRTVFPGLADLQWIKDREIAWGKGSPLWLANVEGKFVKAEQGQLFTIEAITESELRWDDAPAEGRLAIGCDVAGEGEGGDETAFAVRRGMRLLELYAVRSLSEDGILEHLLGLLRKHRTRADAGDDITLVILDRDGQTGARVFDVVRAYNKRNDKTEAEFTLIGFRGSAPPKGRMAELYRLSRDMLFGGLVDWMRDGGAIVADMKLEGELTALRWLDAERGRSTLIAKRDLRATLGRSPDRCDAVALSTWGEHRRAPTFDIAPVIQPKEPTLDPYEAEDQAVIDPYESPSYRGR